MSAFAVREGFRSDITSLAFAVLVLPQVLSLGIEPALVLWAGRQHRPTTLAVALGGMALSLWLAALAPDLVCFGLAFAGYAPASGVALGLAEASLIDQRSCERERVLTQWMLAGTLGDLSAPLLLWTFAAFDWSFRVALGAAGMLLCGVSLVVLRVHIETPDSGPYSSARSVDAKGSWRPLRALRTAWCRFIETRAHVSMLLWLCATASCTFMDEVLAVFVGLRVHRITADAALVAQSLLAFTLGGTCGLVLLERRLRTTPARQLLVIACVGSALCFGGWVLVLATLPDLVEFSPLLLLLAGAFTTAHYPLTLARAYAAVPEDSTLVAATAQAFGALELAVPLLLGLVADRWGLSAALGALLLQPFGILAVVWWSARSSLHPDRGERTLPP